MSKIETHAVPSNYQNRRTFRTIARNSSGETYDAADGDKLMFASIFHQGHNTVTAVVSYRPADKAVTVPADSHYHHELNYLFVHPRHKGVGQGAALLAAVEAEMLRRCPQRPIHIESAHSAVHFFAGRGYRAVGEPIDCVCAGSRLFSQLQHMEKPPPP